MQDEKETGYIKIIGERNYFSMINKSNDGFGDNGWADGYADMPSDHEEILNQLYGKVLDTELIQYLNLYLQGYDLGSWMSEEADEIYDEDGCLKEDSYSFDTLDQETFARQLVLTRRQSIK